MFKNEYGFQLASFCSTIIPSLFLLSFLHSSFAQDKQTDSIRFHKKTLFFSAGMGISWVNAPSFTDYLKEEVPFTNKDSIKSYSVGFEFFGGLEAQFSKQFSLKLDYSYFFKTFTYDQFNYAGYTFYYFYLVHRPYLMAYYIIPGKNYAFKLGGGLGFLYSILHRTDAGATDVTYTSTGFGLRGEVIFSAKLSRNMESYFSGFVKGDTFTRLKDANNNSLISPLTGKETNLSSFGIGARLGFSIKLN